MSRGTSGIAQTRLVSDSMIFNMTDKVKIRSHGLVNKPDQAMRWLERLTPQGSEFFDDPENCFAFVVRKRDSDWETIKRQQKRIRELESLVSANNEDEGAKRSSI